MDKTIKINLGGTLFQIDEEAYRILHDYLKSINSSFRNVPGGNETIEDIESRIAEIFLSQKGLAGVITKDNVEAMITIIGKPEDFGHQVNDQASHEYSSYSKNKKMFRNTEDRIIGGVCGGIGAYMDTDPVWIRILFVIFSLFFGFGFFIYLALWIALPTADNGSGERGMSGYTDPSIQGKNKDVRYQNTSKVGNAFNELFRALGKVCFIIVRIFLIIFGTLLVLTGFLALLAFVMVFVFKYPGAFSTDVGGMNLSYLPDFLNYIVTPSIVPWIKALIILSVSMPLLAIIYGGIRLIFWFRARDGFIWLAGFVIWVLSAAALSIILFNEGISYTESASSSSENYFKSAPDTIYIISGKKMADLNTDNEFSIPDEEYYVTLSDEKKEIYIRASLNINNDDNNKAKVIVNRHSAGRSRLDAISKAERLMYNFNISGDTLVIDEFFTIPAETKWSFDNLDINLYAPTGTVIYMDKTTERLFHSHHYGDFDSDSGNRFRIVTEDGLSYTEPEKTTRK